MRSQTEFGNEKPHTLAGFLQSKRFILFLALSFVLCPLFFSIAFAQGEKIIFPKTDRPANFSFAAGSYDNLAVRATPSTVQVEEPITLVVTITSLVPGPFAHPPKRDLLLLFPAGFENDFFVEEVPEQDRFLDGQNAWEFVYRIFPRHAGIKAIRALQFAYYQTVGQRKYQGVASTEIPIEVKPRAGVRLDAPATIRARMHPAGAGSSLLAGSGPSTLLIVLAFALPPVLAVAGVGLWQRFFPDVAARARLRRSRAFRQATKQLHRLGPRAPAAGVAGVLVQYLRARIDLATAEPTPLELKAALLTVGMPEELAQSVERFCHACYAERFGPAGASAGAHFAGDAIKLLQALEKSLTADNRRSERNSDNETKKDAFFSFSGCLLVLLAAAWPSSPDAATLADADRWFQLGIAEQDSTAARQAFAQAARHYQQLVDNSQHQPLLLRQLGDAYLLAEDLPHAIFAYRRALKQAPHLQAVRDHLELARDRVPYPHGDDRHRPAPSDWPSWLPRPSPAMLLLSAAALHALAWTALACWWMRRQTRALVWAGLFLGAALGVVGWWGYGQWQQYQEGRRPLAVVAFNNMTLRRGNGTMFAPHADLPTVHRGMEARLLHERGGWMQVEFPGGEVGWLPQRALLIEEKR
jgi:tetratricopeptide (TPR) repeat protein